MLQPSPLYRTAGISSLPTVRVRPFSSGSLSGSTGRPGPWGSEGSSGAFQGCHTARATARAASTPKPENSQIFAFLLSFFTGIRSVLHAPARRGRVAAENTMA